MKRRLSPPLSALDKMQIMYAKRKGISEDSLGYLAPEATPRFTSDQCIVLAEYIQGLETSIGKLEARVKRLENRWLRGHR